MNMIHTSNLTKTYGSIVAVDKINLDILQGQIVGYLGPNGAGKSTTVRMLVGVLRPTSGEALVAGYDVVQDNIEVKKRVGYVPETVALYESLTPVEYLRLVGRLYHIKEIILNEKIWDLIDLFDMNPFSSQRISSLSMGMKQKVLILSALIHNPDILFLDEPFSHLDVSSIIVMKRIIQTLANEGKTIFYCTHNLDTVESICQRVIIINKGKIVADGNINELRDMTTLKSLEDIFIQLTNIDNSDRKASEIVRSVKR